MMFTPLEVCWYKTSVRFQQTFLSPLIPYAPLLPKTSNGVHTSDTNIPARAYAGGQMTYE